MAGIASLIVKIGAQDAEITAALAKLGTNVKRTEDEFKKLGATPIAQRAQQSLQTLDETIKGIQTSQSRLADRAKLAAAGIEAMGGPARLTARELEQVNRVIKQGLDAYRALGQEAPKELQKVSAAVEKQRKDLSADAGSGKGGGLSSLLGLTGIGAGALSAAGVGGTVVALAKGALDAADNLTKLSDRTGIAIEGLQRLQAVAEPSGNSLDQVASAVNQFQKRLSEGSKDTVSALGEIGLSIGQLRALSPDEQFFAIAKGIQSIKDPAEQTRIAMELFGKSGAELLPTLKADVDGLKDSTVKMSAESAKALDDFGDGLSRLKSNAVAMLGDMAGSTLQLVGSLKQLPSALREANAAAEKRQGRAVSVPNMAANFGPNGLNIAPEVLAKLTPQQIAMLVRGEAVMSPKAPSAASAFGATAPLGPAIALGAAVDLLSDGLKNQVRAADEAVASGKRHKAELVKLAEAQASVNAALRGYLTVADTVDGATVEAIRYLRDHGAAMSDLATYYGLTAQQADAVARKLDFEAMVARAATGIHAKLATSIYDTGKALDKLNSIPDRTRIPTLQAGPNPQLVQNTRDFEQGLKGVSEALSLVAQISGESFGGMVQQIGSVVSQINLANQALKQFSGAALTAGQQGATAIATIGFNVIFALGAYAQKQEDVHTAIIGLWMNSSQVLAQYSADVQRYVGRDVIQAFQDAIRNAQTLEEAQRHIAEMTAALSRGQDFMGDVQATVGMSQSQRDDAVKRAREVLDYVNAAQQRYKDGRSAVPEFTEDQVNAAYIAWQRAMADAGDVAAQAWIRAHDAAMGGAGSVNAAFDALKAKRDGLAQSIANEAPEEVMGVIETQIRGQIAALDAEMTGSAESTVQALQDAFADLELHARIVYDWPVGGGVEPSPVARGGLVVPGGVQYFDRGGRVLPFLPKGTDTVPAMLTPGEIVINAAQQGRIASALVGGGGTTTVILEADGRTLAELMVPHVPGALKRYRVA